MLDSALLILRLVVGGYLAAHGAQKLFGWFGGHGFAGTQGFLGGRLGFRPAWLWTLAIGLAEFGGGLLLALGLLTPLGASALVAAMLAVIVVAHWSKGPWNADGGYELPLTNLAVAAALALAGPGAYSLDSAFGISVPAVVSQAVALLSLIGAVVAIASRRTLAAATPQAPAAKAA